MDISRPGPCTKQVKSRHTRGINIHDFRKDIRSSLESLSSVHDLDTMVNGYNDILATNLDKYAPEKERTVIFRLHAPW